MRADGPASRALVRLDAEVLRALSGRDRVVLAFSGGLGSLVLAAVARKRWDLRCVVVGHPHAADVEAARVAQKFLDYPVSVLRPSAQEASTVARRIRSANLRLPLPEALALVPLALVEERHPQDRVLSGFGLTARTPSLRGALEPRAERCPGLRLRIARSTRTPLIRMAEAAGLPSSFVQAAPRGPLEGSGLGPELRAMARSRHVSLDRFLSVDGPLRENHERHGQGAVPKSLDVD